jgi:hypothetical protein
MIQEKPTHYGFEKSISDIYLEGTNIKKWMAQYKVF